MNKIAYHTTARLVALMMIGAVMIGRAEDKPKPPPVKPPTVGELRSAIIKSLAFLAKDGEEWMSSKSCNSCHEMPSLLWSFREAKQRGFAVDQSKFEDWFSWTVDQLKSQKNDAIAETSLLTLAVPDKATPEVIQRITTHQKPDGTWDPKDVIVTMQRRGSPDGDANLIRLCLTALSATPAGAHDAEAAQAKAAAVLQKKDPASSMESLSFRTQYARRFGKPEEVKALCEQIIKLQRGDGGWSLYLNENQSDPLGTGHALYALQPAASDLPAAEAIARAENWLLKTQREDGSWPIDITHVSLSDRSAPDKAKSIVNGTKIFTFWGSAWATIGLLQAVPVK